MEAMGYPRMENLIQTASDRRRLFRTGAPAAGPINPIVYAYGPRRKHRLHWVIACALFLGMGALSITASHLEQAPDTAQATGFTAQLAPGDESG